MSHTASFGGILVRMLIKQTAIAHTQLAQIYRTVASKNSIRFDRSLNKAYLDVMNCKLTECTIILNAYRNSELRMKYILSKLLLLDQIINSLRIRLRLSP